MLILLANLYSQDLATSARHPIADLNKVESVYLASANDIYCQKSSIKFSKYSPVVVERADIT